MTRLELEIGIIPCGVRRIGAEEMPMLGICIWARCPTGGVLHFDLWPGVGRSTYDLKSIGCPFARFDFVAEV